MLSPPIRLLVVDDHPVVREGMALLVARRPSIALVGEARSGAEAIAHTRELAPDVVLLDLRLPDLPATDVVAGLRAARPRVRIILFTAYADPSAWASLADSVEGVLLKDAGGNDFVAAIEAVARGERVVDPRVAGGVGDGPLTPREHEVLRRVAVGETNPEIAEAIGLSRNTVKSYLQSASAKLGARNRVDAVARAHALGLL